ARDGEWNDPRGDAACRAPTSGRSHDATIELDTPPDVYYIILDGYPRADILAERYGYDNSEFLEGLESRGFYIADGSHSNYGQTILSLTSSLNMDYLDTLIDIEASQDASVGILYPFLKNNRVLQEF